ncbi:AMP-binding protein [Govanella unica]|uniref:AMP-binding protein n=1 Tax=Govanella unica TaxID=2975056 RepID=A0A9X3Z714_9PROT|nr:AMP-binding protein [Govania unica]MDA5193504.1 AMP-binding protein [Govania unica]
MTSSDSVYSAFQTTAQSYGDRPFLHIPAVAAKAYADHAIDLTYGAALHEIDALTARYGASGLGLGDRVAVLLDNRAEFFLHWIALNALGVSIVPLNGEATVDDLAYIVGDSQPRFILALSSRRELAEKFGLPVVLTTDLSTLPKGTTAQAAPGPRTECALLYTSGSTGKPKGCILSNEYFYVMGDWYRNLGGLVSLKPGAERLLTPLPLVHMNALATSAMGMILTGGCIIQLDRFHASSWWSSIRDSGATVIHYLGVLPAILLNLPESPDDRAHAVRFGFGAGINAKHHAAFEARFGIALLEAWSMTEVGGAAAVIAQYEPRHVGTSCFGKPESFMDWRLVDDAGQDVTKGSAGELLVRRAGADPRAGFFSGYLGREQETAEAWAGDWFHTGDVVREGPDGSLHFVDRKKSIIRRSGENIASLEVEATLSQIPGVQAVGVAPVPDEIRGEEVFAAIILSDAAGKNEDTARAIVRAAGETLTYYKVPGYVAFRDSLPLTASQKLQRGELKTLARQLVDDGTAFDLRDMKSKSARKTG